MKYINCLYSIALPEDQLAESSNQEDVQQSEVSTHGDHAGIEPTDQLTVSNEEPFKDSQTFYPSYSAYQNPPLGHSRPPFYYQPEAAYSHRPSSAYQQHVGYDNGARLSGYKDSRYEDRSVDVNGVLGSGNFGVLKGGTFYNDNDDAYTFDDDYSSYYQNGHGRQSFYNGNSRPQRYQQFENFKDFADINTPSNPAYSQFVIVYANKNDTKITVHPKSRPKNIIERLAMLDLEPSLTSTTEASPTKKLSKSKRKLALLKPDKKILRTNKIKITLSKDLYEPLLALSWTNNVDNDAEDDVFMTTFIKYLQIQTLTRCCG